MVGLQNSGFSAGPIWVDLGQLPGGGTNKSKARTTGPFKNCKMNLKNINLQLSNTVDQA